MTDGADGGVSSAYMTAGENIAAVVRERILSGEIAPGERLTLMGIGREFGVSKIPVRDALRELEKEHLVEGRPMWGYRVAEPNGRQLLGRYYLREGAECTVARLCAGKITPLEKAELEALAAEADKFMPEVSERSGPEDVEIAFHRRLALIAGFPVLAEIVVQSINYVGTFWGIRKSEWGLSHMELIREIAAGDPDRAERAMRRHLEPADDDIEALMRGGGRTGQAKEMARQQDARGTDRVRRG